MKTCFVLALLMSGIVTAQPPGTFAATGSMTTPRTGHTATLLPDGKVLIAGGGSATVELYDPSTGTFTPTAALTASKFIGSATLLPDGRVLLIEAFRMLTDPSDKMFHYTRNAELYDPSTGTVSATGNLIDGQAGYTATLLTNGNVLITGGSNTESTCCSKAANPELYDPSTQGFSLAGPYADTGARSEAGAAGLLYTRATLLPDGTVLIASESAAEIFDPASNTFRLTASMTAEAYFGNSFKPDTITGRAATLLLNGKVLLTGGSPGEGDFDTGYGTLNSTELYDFLRGRFTQTGDMTAARSSHAVTLLTDGTVLITGGFSNLGSTPVAELYSPGTGTFFVAGKMEWVRVFHQATLLSDGRVLISGGSQLRSPLQKDEQVFASAELYTPTVVGLAPALLSLSGDGKGQGAILHAGTPQVVSAGNPAVAGETLEIYCTGLADGGMIPPQVAISGRAAEVLYFGRAPGYAGLNQINVRVPAGVAPGSAFPVRLRYLDRSSNTVTIGVE